MHVAVAVLRVPERLDYTGIIADVDISDLKNNRKSKKSKKLRGVDNPLFVPDEKLTGTETQTGITVFLNEFEFFNFLFIK